MLRCFLIEFLRWKFEVLTSDNHIFHTLLESLLQYIIFTSMWIHLECFQCAVSHAGKIVFLSYILVFFSCIFSFFIMDFLDISSPFSSLSRNIYKAFCIIFRHFLKFYSLHFVLFSLHLTKFCIQFLVDTYVLKTEIYTASDFVNPARSTSIRPMLCMLCAFE